MRQPFGSTWRLTRECKMTTKSVMPVIEVINVSIEIAQGVRETGRRGGILDSAILSRSRACFVVGTAPVSRSDDEEELELEGKILATDPFRASAGFQLKLPERRLLAEVGLELSGEGSRLFLWNWLGATEPVCAERPGMTLGASTGERPPSSEDPDERLLIPGSFCAGRFLPWIVARRSFPKSFKRVRWANGAPAKSSMADFV